MKIEQSTSFDLMALSPRKGSHTARLQERIRNKQLSAKQRKVTLFECFDCSIHSSEFNISSRPDHIDLTPEAYVPEKDRVRANCIVVPSSNQ